ncbi:hypothetical protein QE152_g27309 [Popillia japonica]|uniref:Uncharacterized protein n=1 Tax=Popillia japonica TaxID=7064 RepID=A0AAW1JTI3_POPJA
MQQFIHTRDVGNAQSVPTVHERVSSTLNIKTSGSERESRHIEREPQCGGSRPPFGSPVRKTNNRRNLRDETRRVGDFPVPPYNIYISYPPATIVATTSPNKTFPGTARNC